MGGGVRCVGAKSEVRRMGWSRRVKEGGGEVDVGKEDKVKEG